MRKRTLFFMLLLALPSTSFLVATPLGLDEALAQAKAKNQSFEVATLTLQQAQRESETNDFLPSVSLDVGVSAKASIANASIGTSYSVGSLSFSLSNTDGYSAKDRTITRQIAENTYENTVNTLEGNLTTAYWNVSAAQIAVDGQQLDVEKAQRSYEAIEEAYEGGTATTLETAQAKLELSDAKLTLYDQQQTLQEAMDKLNLLMGTTGDWEPEALPEIKTPVAYGTLTTLIAQTTTIKALALARDKAELTATSTRRSNKGPIVSVSASSSLSGNLATDGVTATDNTSVSLSVSIPLDVYLKDSKAHVAIDTAEYAVRIAEANYAQGMNELTAEVKSSYEALVQSIAKTSQLEEHLALARTELHLVQESYDAGRSGYNELKTSKESVRSAELSILQQQLNYVQALYALGYLLETEPATLTV